MRVIHSEKKIALESQFKAPAQKTQEEKQQFMHEAFLSTFKGTVAEKQLSAIRLASSQDVYRCEAHCISLGLNVR